jgi:hypothetical protein
MDAPQLSVIVGSDKRDWLANCMYQYHAQSRGSLETELIVVVEGREENFSSLKKWKSDKFICKPDKTMHGCGAKDLGITLARGQYLCFWDDDNIYYPHALATLYATAKGYDIGIVQVYFQNVDFNILSPGTELGLGLCDTMNFCVRRELALQEKWLTNPPTPTNDWNWMSRLLTRNPTVRHVDISIGDKLLRNWE